MSTTADAYQKASIKTANDLKTIAATPQIAELSRLTLPEIEALTDQIAQVTPAGNVPGLILNGLTRIEGRYVPQDEQRKHIAFLFRGVRALLDKVVYGAMFAGPAAVIIGYQNLLRLAGKDVDAAFPDGTWQFYLEFALREDSARHTNETVGFQRALAAHQIKLSATDDFTAWIMAALTTLQSYDRLLENEWRERVYTALLKQSATTPTSKIEAAYSVWEGIRPYGRGQDAGRDDYPTYRRHKFDAYLQPLLASLSEFEQQAFASAIAVAEHDALPAYLRQMSILARLEPGPYQETRVPYLLSESGIAIVYTGRYSFIPTMMPDGRLTDLNAVRSVVASLLGTPPSEPASELDLLLIHTRRAAQAAVRAKTDHISRKTIDLLGYAPIILNGDHFGANQPLAVIRQAHRGIGDHALTLFFTDESTIFDQSHIFFDGAWGAALAEVMSNEALAWASYLSRLPAASPTQLRPSLLRLAVNADVQKEAEKAKLGAEATGETTTIRLAPVLAVRRLFKTRNDLVNVTVNDLLVLYRTIFGQRYEPATALKLQLDQLQSSRDPGLQKASTSIIDALDKVKRNNPAILIPMDATHPSPRERLYPTTFRNPMQNLLSQHEATCKALAAYKNAQGDRATFYESFDEHQRTYLRMIASFGMLMRKYKEIALSGESVSTVSIKLLAHMPDIMQHLLNEIPGRFDVLNEVIKGEEVFSNVGRVVKGSTLRRFITAKDDNEQKTLAWGVITDDLDIVRLSLRDFRPHVAVLYENGLSKLANQLTQDFVDAYADGFNLFVRELRDITTASRETQSRDIMKNGHQ